MTVHAVEVCAGPSGKLWKIRTWSEHSQNVDRHFIKFNAGKTFALPDAGLQVRAAAASDVCCAVMRGFKDYPFAVFSDGRIVRLKGKVAGNYATIIEWNAGFDFTIGVLRSANTWDQIQLGATGNFITHPNQRVPDRFGDPGGGTSHGFLDMIDGEPTWDHLGDSSHRMQRGPYTVWMHSDPNWIRLDDGLTHQYFPGTEAAQLPPRLALDARGEPHVAVTVGHGLFLTTADARPWPPPATPAPAPSSPLPPAPPEETFNMGMTVQDAKALVLGHPLGHQILGRPTGPGREDERRLNAWRFCNQVVIDARAQGGDNVFLLKNPNHTNVLGFSPDCVVVQTGTDTFLHFDIVGASEAENATPQWSDNGPIHRSDGQAPGEPVPDGGGEIEPPAPTPPAPVPVPEDDLLAQLLQGILHVQALQEQRAQRIEALAELARTRAEAIQLQLDNLNQHIAALTEAIGKAEGVRGYTGFADIKFLGRARIELEPTS